MKKELKPFSNNIIFLDTEFSSLDPKVGEILSIGLVKPNGEELYLELEYDGPVSDWVKEKQLKTFTAPKVNREEAKEKINKFVGNSKPFAVINVDHYDMIYLIKMFGEEDLPFHKFSIDFSALIFASGENPEEYLDFIKSLGVSQKGYEIHNALDDAKLLKDAYNKFFDIK